MDSVTWLRPEYQGRETELIHLSAGAELVGVTRSAVSNWAARHANFPRIVMLTGMHGMRIKYVVRDEFLSFAREQRKKPRSRAQKMAPRRPRTVIETDRAQHWQRQVERLTLLEAKHDASLRRTRDELAEARRKLHDAKAGLAAEIQAVRQIAKEAQ